MRVHVTVAVLATALATGLAGCTATGANSSSTKFTGEQGKVAAKIADLQSDGSGGKAADVCDKVVTGDLKAKLAAPGSTCEQEMKKAMQDADGFDLEVTGVQINGPKATATVRSKGRGKTKITRTFGLTQAGGGWRISSFG
jgi:hypothetical protein